MTLQQLNESSWIGKVGKTFKEKGTAGAFTQQCELPHPKGCGF